MKYIKLVGYPPVQGVPKEIANNYNNVSTIITTVSLYPNMKKVLAPIIKLIMINYKFSFIPRIGKNPDVL